MAVFQFANDASSTLAAPISNVATTVNLAVGTGALFPSPGAGQQFALTFNDAATGLLTEVVYCTARSGDALTIVRAQEGTTAQTWIAADLASNLLTAGTMQGLAQVPQAQGNIWNYAVDSGAANAYVVAFSPAVGAVVAGTPIWVKIAHTNTGASTLNFGAGALPIINPDSTTVGGGAMSANGIYLFTPDGAGNVILLSANNGTLSSQGIATTGDIKFRPTVETITGWIIANATTIGNATSGATQLASLTAAQLYSWLWTNFSNSQCPVSGGRGANPTADFTASKAIQVLDMRGYAIAGVDTMQGGATARLAAVTVVSGNNTTPGSILGEAVHTLITAEMPVTTPGGTVGAITITDTRTWGFSYLERTFPVGTGANLNATDVEQASSVKSVVQQAGSISASTPSFTGTPFGSGSAHNNTQLSMLGQWYIKL